MIRNANCRKQTLQQRPFHGSIALFLLCGAMLASSCASTSQYQAQQTRASDLTTNTVSNNDSLETIKEMPSPQQSEEQAKFFAQESAFNTEKRSNQAENLESENVLERVSQDTISQPSTADDAQESSETQPKRSPKFLEALKEQIQKRMQERLQKREEQQTALDSNVIEQDQAETTELPNQAQAPQSEEEQVAMERAEQQIFTEITGLVIDQTISPFGSYFYDKFYINFEHPQISQDYTIYITEKASPSFGFILRIKVDDYTIWGKNLRPRLQEIDDSVNEALQRVQYFLLNYEQMLQQLGGNDMVGDGIL